MWGFSLISFLLQGVYLTPGIGMYISFSINVFVSLCVYHFTNFILKQNKYKFTVEVLCTIFLVTGILIYYFTNNYSFASLFAAIAIAIPMGISSYRLWNSTIGHGSKALSILLFLNSIHFLDYPILRSHPIGAVWGFSIALILLFAFSTFFPGFILLQMSKEYAESLEEKVKIRTKELEEAVDQNKTLVNILCHDLSSPLTVLDFYFEAIMKEKATPVHVKYGEKAVRSLQTLLSIVAKVANFQEISYGKKIVETKNVNLLEVLNERISFFESTMVKKNISFNFTNLAKSDVFIKGDKDLLENQIFANLLSNAIKFSYQNSTISIVVSENVNYVNVTIEDCGIGIPNELLLKLFKWSEKTNRNGTSGERGTGFGLPLVKSCLEMMGGSIRVESTPKEGPESDSGSRFIVQFDKAM